MPANRAARRARTWLAAFVLCGCALARADSWEVVSPGLAGTDFKFVATYQPPASAAFSF